MYKIIEQIKPEVIFEEIPPGKFASVYKGMLNDSLEIYTVKMYMNEYSIDHFPVDMDIDEATDVQFRLKVARMFSLFSYDARYYELSIQIDFAVEQVASLILTAIFAASHWNVNAF